MRARMWSAAGAVAVVSVLVGAAAVAPGGAGADTGGGPVRRAPGTEVIAMHVSGVAESEPAAPGTVAYTVGVFALTTGERLGDLHDEITCSSTTPPPCLVFDVVTTLRLRGGQIVNRAQWSGVPDPQHPGFLLVGSRPDGKTAEGTAGDYAGRPAHWAGSGTVDVREFPGRLGYDIFSVVTVDLTRRRSG